MSTPANPATPKLRARQWFPITVNVSCWAILLLVFVVPSLDNSWWVIVSFPTLYLLNLIAIFFAKTWLVRISQLILALAGFPMAAIAGFIILLML